MTIDERLERLTERHEALAQSLELTASMQREAERQEETERLRNERDAVYNERFHRVLDLIENHERRIQRQESR